jgi:hypothetical protein
MSVIAALSGDTIVEKAQTQTTVVETVDGVEISSLTTVSFQVFNASGQAIDVQLTLHRSGLNTGNVFPLVSSDYRVTVENI